MIRYVIIFISIIFATTAPARANWQNTKWGMPVENVLAVVPKSTRYTDTRIDKQEETVEVAAAYEANGMLFVAFFLFCPRRSFVIHLISAQGFSKLLQTRLSNGCGVWRARQHHAR